MRRTRGSAVHVDSLEEFDRRLVVGARSLTGWRVRTLDLTGRGPALRSVDVAGALFLGCELRPEDEESIRARGAVVFPSVPSAPVDTYRTSLYTPQELYGEKGYLLSLDARVYAWSQREDSRDAALAQSLHDHSIGLALEEWRRGRHLVGVMGGHDAARGTPRYAERARLGRMLAQTHTVASGGGPGAMEAVNLGGHLAAHDETALVEALGMLSTVPSFVSRVDQWARLAFEVRERFPDGGDSLGIPPGITGTSRLTPSRRTSPSTSATRSAKRSCWRCARPASSSCPEQAAPCRRSSRTRARTTTPTSRPSPPWCSWGASTGRSGTRRGRCFRRWRPGGPRSGTCIWSTR